YTASTFPVDGAFINAAAWETIAGKAYDIADTSCIDLVHVAIRQRTDDEWWKNANLDFTEAVTEWNAVESEDLTRKCDTDWSEWFYDSDGNFDFNDLTSGTSYFVMARASDTSGLVESDFTEFVSSFTYDNDEPQSTIALPIHGSTMSVLSAISGTTVDLPAAGNTVNAGTNLVQVYIYRPPPASTATWNGSSWNDASVSWITVDTITVSTQGTDWELATEDPPGFTMPVWEHNTNYLIVARSRDTALNQESSFAVNTDSNTIKFDLWGATAVFTTPSGTYMNGGQDTIAGTASDSPSGIKNFSIAISSYPDDPYNVGLPSWFDGTSSFDQAFSNAVFISSDSGGDWTWSGVGSEGSPATWTWDKPDLTSDTTYMIQLRIEDLSTPANISTFTLTFTYDETPPISSITVPTHGAHWNAGSGITGTASDEFGVSTVSVSIEKITSGNSCYDGSDSFDQVCPYFFGAGGTPTDWNVTGITFVSPFRYLIISSATDSAGNVQSLASYAVGTDSNTFTFEYEAPSSTITKPVVNRSKNLATISGTAEDTAPGVLSLVQIRVKRITAPAQYWDAVTDGGFDLDESEADNAWFTALSTYGVIWENWYSTGSNSALFTDGGGIESGKEYEINVRAQDEAGTWSSISTETTVFDNTTPETAMIYPPIGSSSPINSLTISSGTMADKPAGIGYSSGTISRIWMKLIRLSDGWYWNTGAWQSGSFDMKSNLGHFDIYQSSWDMTSNLPIAGTHLVSGASYYITTSGYDDADQGGNQESFWHVRSSTFVFDSSAPVTTVNLPGHNAMRGQLATISGTTDDKPDAGAQELLDTGIANVEVSIFRLTGGVTAYWDGISGSWDTENSWWVNTDTAGVVNPSEDWELKDGEPSTFTMPALNDSDTDGWEHDATYVIAARALDNAGNQENIFVQGT
ncbi:hypothetical protein ACFL6Y_11860, partial [Elusimicrobiota bacterium]